MLEADWDEIAPSVSPDGKWLAYLSTEAGALDQVFMRRWPDLSGKRQITAFDRSVRANGVMVWSRDSKTLYFQRGLQIWGATLTDEATVDFEVKDTGVDGRGIVWDMHPDGRFVVAVDGALETTAQSDEADAPERRVVVVTNWLTERLGEGR